MAGVLPWSSTRHPAQPSLVDETFTGWTRGPFAGPGTVMALLGAALVICGAFRPRPAVSCWGVAVCVGALVASCGAVTMYWIDNSGDLELGAFLMAGAAVVLTVMAIVALRGRRHRAATPGDTEVRSSPAAKAVGVAAVLLVAAAMLVSASVVVIQLRGDVPVGTQLRARSTQPGIEHVAFSPDGSTIAAADRSGKSITFWNADLTEQIGSTTTLFTTDGVYELAYSPDGTIVAAIASLGRAVLWDVDRGRVHAEFPDATSFAFSPTGDSLAICSSTTRAVEIIDIRQRSRTLTIPDACGQGGSELGFGSDVIAVANPAGTTALYSVHSGGWIAELDVAPRRFVFTPDGSTLVIAVDTEQSIQLWDTTTWTAIGAPLLVGHDDAWSIAVSADGRLLAADDGAFGIRVWDIDRGTTEFAWAKIGWSQSLSFAPDGGRLISAGPGDGATLWTIPH
ncbi:WD40 repeat domain-containing protein [Nocardia sp. NPDC057353]|uniref:WD40 repeat domain-containing protein n=1 Tax=Nocardia sp. NPDC057353 TaxID=3346104 RepID=UPI00363A0BF6